MGAGVGGGLGASRVAAEVQVGVSGMRAAGSRGPNAALWPGDEARSQRRAVQVGLFQDSAVCIVVCGSV